MRPTPRANELSVPVSHILNSMRDLSSSLDFDPLIAEGTVSFLATDYALATIIAPIRERLAEIAPNLKVSVQAYTGEDAISNTQLLSTDLLIGSPSMLPETLQTRHLTTDQLVVFMSTDHPMAHKEMTVQGFTSYPHVLVSLRGKSTRGVIDDLLAEQGCSRTIDTITPSFLSLQMLLGGSERLAIAPQGLAQISQNTLTYQLLPFELPPLELYAAWHKRFTQDKRHIWLRRTLADWISGRS